MRQGQFVIDVFPTIRKWFGCLSALRLKKRLPAYATLVAAAVFFPWRPGVVVGTSMTPTLQPGSFFLYDRYYYRNRDLSPGDVVVLRHNGSILIKRIYATAGDQFWTRREFVDAELVHTPISEPNLGRERRLLAYERKLRIGNSGLVQLHVPVGKAFVIGDGQYSLDSRNFGFVDVDDILGRVLEPPQTQISVVQQNPSRASAQSS
jgi:signal peptidase I